MQTDKRVKKKKEKAQKITYFHYLEFQDDLEQSSFNFFKNNFYM